MSATAWLDQRAAMVRAGREGLPVALGAKKTAERLAERLPDMSREQIGAVLLVFGAILSNTWDQLLATSDGTEDLLALLTCLTDTAGEYLYAPEGGAR